MDRPWRPRAKQACDHDRTRAKNVQVQNGESMPVPMQGRKRASARKSNGRKHAKGMLAQRCCVTRTQRLCVNAMDA